MELLRVWRGVLEIKLQNDDWWNEAQTESDFLICGIL